MSQLGFNKYYKLPLVQKASTLSKLKPSQIVLIFLVAVLVLLLTPVGSFFSTLICFVLPAFSTFKALESENKEDDKRLLTFWVVFGFFYFFDQMLSWLLSFIPLYYLFRTAFIWYLYNPNLAGAEKLYNFSIKPFFERY